jgi:hypothetical protein
MLDRDFQISFVKRPHANITLSAHIPTLAHADVTKYRKSISFLELLVASYSLFH